MTVLVLAAATVFGLFAWQGRNGFNLWDEGYLWYGVQRVLDGEVPLRDFLAYDPGRYYWAAAWMGAWRDSGIMSLRVAVALFQLLGLFVGLQLINKSAPPGRSRAIFLLVGALTLAVWMFPRHKLFDISISILLVGVFAYLVYKPVLSRYFMVGMSVGLAAVLGRNHGFYAALASVLVFVWLRLSHEPTVPAGKTILAWAAGVLLGYSPILLMVLFVPGFATAFWQSVAFIFEVQATNLPLPVPWPWRADFSLVGIQPWRQLLVGLFFLALPIFSLLALIWIFVARRRRIAVSPVLVASAVLSIPYAHYAFSRADVGHLAQGIFPMLLGCIALLAATKGPLRWVLLFGLAAASAIVMVPLQPGVESGPGRGCVKVDAAGSALCVDQGTARDIALLKELAASYAPHGENVLITPFWPGAYPILGRKSVIYGNYLTFPRDVAYQQAEIARIEKAAPAFVLVNNLALDGRADLQFSNAESEIFKYLESHMRRVDLPGMPPYYLLFVKPQ
ncbi:hypothetical protein CAL12_26875 [Bordetella genomosp. 8]|uniref:Glycosyltransferase RgtA/B/C/D-like domain-containing protein n=2 Tax=Bordetella genomosp. 8 TaxID=1416806 RepID=A0A1W6YSU9_9BORD|nr:hypothetical protein CAL12_26875 [Bordetella genomosp. 8]